MSPKAERGGPMRPRKPSGRNPTRGALTERAAPFLSAAGVLAALMASVALAAGLVTVSQRDRQFTPDHLVLSPGTALRILNDDNVTHHVFVDSPEMSFDSGEQPIGATVELHFDKRGSFEVQCAIHPAMLLRVT